MEDRLLLAKQLLKPEKSVLIATIDEKEYLPLGMLLKQVFPEAKIQMVSSIINPASVTRANEFGRTDEYLFFVMIGAAGPQKIHLADAWKHGSGKGAASQGKLRWNSLSRTGTSDLRVDRENLFYPVYVSEDGKQIVDIGEALPLDMPRENAPSMPGCKTIFPIHSDGKEGRWRCGPEKLRRLQKEGYVKLGRFTEYGMAISYLADGERAKVERGDYQIKGHDENGCVIIDRNETITPMSVPGTSWEIPSHDATQFGSKLNSKFLPDRKFPYPKSLYAVEDCLRFFVADNPNALIMDFFAGSGTTAHAVMRLNKQYGGHRQCIVITNNEMGPDEEEELLLKGYRPGDDEWEAIGVCSYITKPRIKAAITGIDSTGKPVKGNYGILTEQYIELDSEKDNIIAANAKTGKPMKRTIYQKKKAQDSVVPDPFPMADGFKENAIFFDLVYNAKGRVEMGLEFANIAPLLWLKAGGSGEIITEEADEGYAISKNYAVLFDSTQASQMLDAIKDLDDIVIVYIVEDEERIYQQIARRLPQGIKPQRLYEPYVRTFSSYTR